MDESKQSSCVRLFLVSMLAQFEIESSELDSDVHSESFR